MNSRNKQSLIGFSEMLLSALVTCTAQLFLKLSGISPAPTSFLFLLIGLACYALGAILMLYAFRRGEASVLHPVLSVGYIGSLILARFFLQEEISVQKLIGVFLILVGLFLTVFGSTEKSKSKKSSIPPSSEQEREQI